MEEIKKIAILTSGGDCCGLNAVIESVTKTAIQKGYEVIGFESGYDGLYENKFVELTVNTVKHLGSRGGSILRNSNKTNLFNHRVKLEDGTVVYRDDSAVAIENLKKDNVDCLIIVGGDGSMTSARDFMRAGVKVVCIPKTIDNDVPYTDQTFGYSTAVASIADALSCVYTTGHSHDRIMVLEVMGRHAGWLALEGGIAGEADIIIIPEIPYSLEGIANKLIERYKRGHNSSIICVSEGAAPKDGEIISYQNNDYPDSVKLGGIGAKLAHDLERIVMPITNQEVRSTSLGYVQRGGNTNSFDKVLSFRYGSFAVEAIEKGEFGKMVALRGEELAMIPLINVVGDGPTGETSKGGNKNVNLDCDLIRCAKSMGIYLGE